MSIRQNFIARLRGGLKGLPSPAIDDIIADYEAHFTEGLARGRTEQEVAAKLGDPVRLSRELRAEAGLRRWEEHRSAASALGAVVAVLGLATIDLLIMLPLVLCIGAVLIGVLVAALCVTLAGTLLLLLALVHILPGFHGSWLQGILLALGIAAGGASVTAICTMFGIGLVNLLARYARLHMRAVSPVLSPSVLSPSVLNSSNGAIP